MSPDAKLIAYVRTGWGRTGGSGGFGRSNLRSEIAVMTTSGEVLSPTPVANAFLFGWTSDGNNVVCYRDWHFLLAGVHGGQVTSPDEDTTYDLNWAGNHMLVFDRISDRPFYSHARLWTASVLR